MNSSEILKRKQEARFNVLQRTYELTQGDSLAIANYEGMAREFGLTMDELDSIVIYLTDEGLLKAPVAGRHVSITHAGIKEFEDYIQNPQRGTEHFSLGNLTQNFYAPVGSNQTGSHNIANVQMNNSDTELLLNLIGLIKTSTISLPSNQHQEILAEIGDIEQEINQPQEKPNRKRNILRSLNDLIPLIKSVPDAIDAAQKIRDFIMDKF